MVDQADQVSDEIEDLTTKGRRYIYLAGAVEIVDTWRERAATVLREAGFETLDPMRGEKCAQKGKHVVSDISGELIVARDLNDLRRVADSGGLCLMHLKTTAEGRAPTATLCELMFCYDHGIPVIAVIGPKCAPILREHPWVKVLTVHRPTSLTAALDLITSYFA